MSPLCVDLSEKKSDLMLCDDSSCRFGGVCRDDGAQLKCVCQLQVRRSSASMKMHRPVWRCNPDRRRSGDFWTHALKPRVLHVGGHFVLGRRHLILRSSVQL
ncbi:Tomoregulin-1 [Liparis tanakae]|uniref:Tomoregulin-1 n=1 Tax=Liparis tanakae TaxID=230148 RepID=A0A4Z2E091_9TELE|nr:Tomoregulin-1 [Liparis tanakae]